MTKFIATFKAIITRLVFALHAFIAIWQVTTFKKNPYYWYLCGPIILLFLEGVFTVTIKINHEWKWFCPSVFFYLASVVPAIWIIELDKLEKGMKTRGPSLNISEALDLTNLAADDLKHLEKVFGVNITLPEIRISAETWVTLIEQFLMLVLIIGRWMLPKGDLTRDQLSQLLLVYIGTAADIIEFFDSFKEDKIGRELVLVYLTLSIWSWSLIQFTVVLTATKSRKCRLSSGTTIKQKIPSETSCCNIDVWAITINMILQDAPFLAFRLIIIIHYRIVSYMNIFFTCKNTLVILLQLYRLYVVQSQNNNKKKNKKRQNKRREINSNISVISGNDLHKSKGQRYERKYRRVIEDPKLESEDYSSEKQDIVELSQKHHNHSKRQMKQDAGYSSSVYHTKYLKRMDGGGTSSSSRDVVTHAEILSCDEDTNRKSARNNLKRVRKSCSPSKHFAIRDRNERTMERKENVMNNSIMEESSEGENISFDETETELDQRYARCK